MLQGPRFGPYYFPTVQPFGVGAYRLSWFRLDGASEGDEVRTCNIGALMIRTGSWGTLYCSHNREPPKVI